MSPLLSLLFLGLAASVMAGPSRRRQILPFYRRQPTNSIRNDLAETGCKSYIVIFARGTTEEGNVGTSTGPPFFDALSAQVGGDLAVQGVEYSADWGGAVLGGDGTGSENM